MIKLTFFMLLIGICIMLSRLAIQSHPKLSFTNKTDATLTIYYENTIINGLNHRTDAHTKTSLAYKRSSQQNIPLKGDYGSMTKLYVCMGQTCSANNPKVIASLSMKKSSSGEIKITNKTTRLYQWVKTPSGTQDIYMSLRNKS